MKKYLALLLAVMLVFSCALPAVSAVTPSDNVELTEDTSSEPEGFRRPVFRTDTGKPLRT